MVLAVSGTELNVYNRLERYIVMTNCAQLNRWSVVFQCLGLIWCAQSFRRRAKSCGIVGIKYARDLFSI